MAGAGEEGAEATSVVAAMGICIGNMVRHKTPVNTGATATHATWAMWAAVEAGGVRHAQRHVSVLMESLTQGTTSTKECQS